MVDMTEPAPPPTISLDVLKARHAALAAEHAGLWREISFSPAWQRLTQLEGRMAELESLITELAPPESAP